VVATALRPSVQASPLRLAVMTDLGVPDGGTVAVALTPAPKVRIHAGISHNLVGPGWRAGITLVPVRWWVSPTISLDYGRYPDADANPLARRIAGDPLLDSPALDHLGYQYAKAQLGMEFGRSWVALYIHAGASRVAAVVHGLDEELRDLSSDRNPQTTVTFSSDPTLVAWMVSARVGMIFYLNP
jgi:hypothetical protein